MREFEGTERFEIIRCLGTGGMGVVYEANDREQEVKVALKTLRTHDAETLLRFKNEFRALQEINHPNLVRLGELFEERGHWFFTMELVHGVDFIRHVRPADEVQDGDVSIKRVDMETMQGAGIPDARARLRPTPDPKPISGPGFEESRLRPALLQLAQAIAALHRAGHVHRDIKPSNILVTPAGRVVLLDFGLIAVAGTRNDSNPSVVGTADYMAPEQAAAGTIGPEADWYAMGALLYEAMIGRPPFVGTPIEVVLRKQGEEPKSPRIFNVHVPDDLDALCAGLLRREPFARPRETDIIERLDSEKRDAPAAPAQPRPARPAFVGRQEELAVMRHAFQRSCDGHTVAVFVHGESGIGKSALVREFTAELGTVEDAGGAVVFAGQCYERESVPYKAFDAVMDALTRYLGRVKQEAVDAILPLRAGLLTQVFPVLRRVEAVARLPISAEPRLGPAELRDRVFAALRELFARLSARRAIVLVIDDLQWADADSLSPLRALLRPPDAPPLVLVATLPTLPHAERWLEDVLSVLSVKQGNVHHVALEALPPEESGALVDLLLPESERKHAASIITESGGHPLFIHELARPDAARGGARLDDVLWSRVAKLAPQARRLLELCSVSSGPLRQESAARAAQLDGPEFGNFTGTLRAAHFVRTSGARPTDLIEPYHDRIRQAILAHLPPSVQRTHHERLALSLEASERVAPERVAVHWLGADNRARAAHYFALAAPRAITALAFDHAARLYRLALELGLASGPGRKELHIKLGDALAAAGRSLEAANSFLAAALDAGPGEALDLQQRAAEHLLRCGQIDEGLKALAAVLSACKLELARTPRRAVASLLYHRARIRLRGLSFNEQDESEIAPAVLRRIDTCWSVAFSLATVDTIRGLDFQTRNLLFALEAGEPKRIARALSLEASYSATAGGAATARTQRLLKEAFDLARRMDDPYSLGWATMAQGFCAFLEGRFKTGHDRCRRAEATFKQRCHGANWEAANAQLFADWTLFYLGRIDELSRRLPEHLRHAREQGDLYAEVSLGCRAGHIAALAEDEPRMASAQLEAALGRWSERTFLVQHFYDLYARAQIALYQGDTGATLEYIQARWAALEHSQLLRVQFIRTEALQLRAQCALAAAAQGPYQRAERVKLVRAASKAIAADRMQWSQPLALLLDAGVTHINGHVEQSVALLDKAATAFDAADLSLYAIAARRRIGQLTGGATGTALLTDADASLRARAIADPVRFARMLVPGFPD